MSREIKFTQHMKVRLRSLIEDMGLTHYHRHGRAFPLNVFWRTMDWDNKTGAEIISYVLERVNEVVRSEGVTSFYIRVCNPIKPKGLGLEFEILINFYK